MLKHILAATALLFASAPAPAAEAAAAPAIPLEHFAELPFLTHPELSPDGRFVAARLPGTGAERIGIFTLGSDAPPALIGDGKGEYDLRWIRWAGNGRLLIGITILAPFMNMTLPVSRLLVYDIETRQLRATGAGNGLVGDEVIHVAPDGGWILLSSQPDPFSYPSVYRIDLATGAAREVQTGRTGVWNWFADDQGVVRAGVEYGNRRMRIFYREAEGAPLRRIESRPYQRDDSTIDSIRFLGENTGIVVSNAETGRFGVYEYDFAADEMGAAIFDHPEVDVTDVYVSRDGRVEGVAYEDDKPRVRWLNEELSALQQTIDRVFPGKSNRIRGRSRDGDRVLVWSGGAHDPGMYFIFTRSAKRMEAFAAPFDKLQDHRFAEVRPVSYQSRDGLTIRGYLTLPPGRAERDLPLIVMPHGGPYLRDSWTFDPQVQFLASRGYAVLQPNFRGSTGYGREFVERGYGQWGTGMVDDMSDGVEWLAREGIADPARVCIMGGSYGGYAALWAPIRDPQRYRCSVAFAAVTDLRAMLRYDRRQFSAPRYARAWRQKVEGEDRADLSLVSPLQQAARLKVPTLIAHGDKDRVVPPSQSRDMVRALTRAGARVESVFYPEAAHGFGRPEDSIDFLRRVEAFLALHNPADGPAPAAAPAAAPSP
ncbi:MAG: alpha/beta fold hydrolase [Allosphingosinicella sp.]|uniref:S9 family peptidase n=1 Tax=Allosphingosinicella sp. TaxID=2823234 RepID=UPI00394B4E23